MTLSDSIVVMNNGVIEQTGTPFRVYEHPRNSFVASFLGKANFFSGTTRKVEEELVTLQTEAGIVTIPALGTKEGERVCYAVRPEKIEMAATGVGLTGTIVSAVYSGSTTVFRVQCGGQEILTEERSAAGQQIFAKGDSVVLRWPAKASIRMEA